MRRRLDSIRLVQQLTNCDLRLPGIIFPFGDCVRHAIVELNQAVAHGTERSDPPKTFGAAENLATHIGATAIGVMLENGLAVLRDEDGEPAFVFGIIRSPGAIAGLNVGERGRRS